MLIASLKSVHKLFFVVPYSAYGGWMASKFNFCGWKQIGDLPNLVGHQIYLLKLINILFAISHVAKKG